MGNRGPCFTMEEFTFSGPVTDGMKCSFKRYRPIGSSNDGDINAITLILGHAVTIRAFLDDPMNQLANALHRQGDLGTYDRPFI